jgi:hypothetical protein
VFAVFQYLCSVDEDMLLLMRIVEFGWGGYGLRIVHDDIGEKSLFEQPALVETNIRGGQALD